MCVCVCGSIKARRAPEKKGKSSFHIFISSVLAATPRHSPCVCAHAVLLLCVSIYISFFSFSPHISLTQCSFPSLPGPFFFSLFVPCPCARSFIGRVIAPWCCVDGFLSLLKLSLYLSLKRFDFHRHINTHRELVPSVLCSVVAAASFLNPAFHEQRDEITTTLLPPLWLENQQTTSS